MHGIDGQEAAYIFTASNYNSCVHDTDRQHTVKKKKEYAYKHSPGYLSDLSSKITDTCRHRQAL